MPNDSRKKLYEGLKSKNLYTKSYEDFNSQFSNVESRRKLYNGIKSKNLYTKSYEDFNNQFFPDVKKKDVSQTPPVAPQTPSTTGGLPQEQGIASVGGVIGGASVQPTVPTQKDVALQSSVTNVASPTALPNQNDIVKVPNQGVSVTPTMGVGDVIRESQKAPIEPVQYDFQTQPLTGEFGAPIDEMARGEEINKQNRQALVEWQKTPEGSIVNDKMLDVSVSSYF